MINARDLSSRFSELSVLVVGDHCLDRDCIGRYSGYSREKESMPIFRIDEVNYKPGGAGNLASNFAALGIKTTAAGVWGDSSDWNRLVLEESFRIRGIDDSGMVTGARTPTFEKYYFPSGHHIWRTDVVSEEINQRTQNALLGTIESLLEDVDFVVVADYDETGRGVSTDNALKLISGCSKTKFGTSRERIIRFADFDYLVLNSKELGGDDIYKQTAHLLDKTGANAAVVTLAGKGSNAFSFREDYQTMFPEPECLEKTETLTKELTEDIDTCGCGDAFLAIFSSCIMAGYDLQESMKMANSGARSVARKLYGAHCTTIGEIKREYKELYSG
jgi:D-beta-D-heptose 7-phosphate kinase/D-beta-D-heptose 1-phosphate adenosyltransferase